VSYFVSFLRARTILKHYGIRKVLSFGGYVSVPVVLAAWTLRIPIVLFEQNALPGRSNRYLSVIASQVCLAFDYSRSFFSKHHHVLWTGNPIRHVYQPDIWFSEDNEWAYTTRWLIVGGSQGAKAINAFIIDQREWFQAQRICVIHILGEAEYAARYLPDQPYVLERDDHGLIAALRVPYANDMRSLLQWATAVVARAGATTIAELIAFQKKALLIPYPYSKDNHQVVNAQVFCETGMGWLVEQALLTPHALERFLHDQESWRLQRNLHRTEWKSLV